MRPDVEVQTLSRNDFMLKDSGRDVWMGRVWSAPPLPLGSRTSFLGPRLVTTY